jgi:hypothetical protein
MRQVTTTGTLDVASNSISAFFFDTQTHLPTYLRVAARPFCVTILYLYQPLSQTQLRLPRLGRIATGRCMPMFWAYWDCMDYTYIVINTGARQPRSGLQRI